jgi:sulfite exporter TauE/SafE
VSFGFINSIVFVFCCFLYLFKCVSSLSVVAVSGDVFYTLSFCLRTLRTMSRFGWGERVVVDIKKKLTNCVFYCYNHLQKPVVTRMAE